MVLKILFKSKIFPLSFQGQKPVLIKFIPLIIKLHIITGEYPEIARTETKQSYKNKNPLYLDSV